MVKSSSVRSYLTMRPLADGAQVRIDGSFKARDFAQLASKLLVNPADDGKRVVRCWIHSELPERWSLHICERHRTDCGCAAA